MPFRRYFTLSWVSYEYKRLLGSNLRWARFVGHYYRAKDQLASDLIL